MMKSVNLFVIGAAKSGTTSLANYLNQHPDIYIPPIKEPKFFTVQDNVFPHRGPGDYVVDLKVIHEMKQYESLYDSAKEYSVCGDASVDYLYYSGAASRIKEYNSTAKIIIMLRNPIERAFSAYMHMVRDGRENLLFEDALDQESVRMQKNWEFFWAYRDVGFYSSQVKNYIDQFTRDSIHIILFEDFVNDPVSVLSKVFKFLEVDVVYTPDTSIAWNKSGRPGISWLHKIMNRPNSIKSFLKKCMSKRIRDNLKRSIESKNLKKVKLKKITRCQLVEDYRSDIEKLESLLGLNLQNWLQ